MSRRRGVLLALLACVALTAVVVALGVQRVLPDDSPEESAPPEPLPTPLADIDTAAVTVVRGEFCDRIPQDAAEAAVRPDAPAGGSEELTTTSYADGEVAQVTDRVEDVAHEFSCTWRAADGRAAQAWVFAPPVTQKQGRDLVESVSASNRCERVGGAAALGAPSVTISCPSGQRHTTVTVHGLLGDAWLSCALTGRRGEARPDLVDRAGRWCVAVMQATSPQNVEN